MFYRFLQKRNIFLYLSMMKEHDVGIMTPRMFIWVVAISQISDRQAKKMKSHIPYTNFGEFHFATVKSWNPSRYLSFSQFPHQILVKSRIPRIPF